MKITKEIIIDNKEEKMSNFDDVFKVLVNKKDSSKQAIVINPNIPEDILLLSVSRLNRVLAKHIGMPYEAFLSLLKNAYNFDEKYGNLDLSEEQLKKIIDKEVNGRF